MEDEVGKATLDVAAGFCKLAVEILNAAGEVLSKWPVLARGMDRVGTKTGGSIKLCHQWRFAEAHEQWICVACGTFSINDHAQPPPQGMQGLADRAGLPSGPKQPRSRAIAIS